ncbi:MAG TPA: TrkA C-terminal domain-containing protein [Solirubrobacteraceae bacterium]|nr:TrkA C-terminal domain-containing protein [Solirubrobacteraceae bacterium]
MVALASILVVVLLSLLITRIATMALVLTGMSREQARFQARSALTGVGFTTAEAESVVGHPVRRRIVMALMLVGGAGVVTVLGGVMLSFAGDDGRNGLKLAILVGGLAALVVLARSRRVDRFLQRPIEWGLRRFTDIEVRDFESLLHLAEGNVVIELGIDPGEWLDGRTLADADLRGEGVVVLGVQRPDGSYLAVPRGDTELRAGDTVIAYGLGERLCDLDERPAGPEGDRAHARAVREWRGERARA